MTNIIQLAKEITFLTSIESIRRSDEIFKAVNKSQAASFIRANLDSSVTVATTSPGIVVSVGDIVLEYIVKDETKPTIQYGRFFERMDNGQQFQFYHLLDPDVECPNVSLRIVEKSNQMTRQLTSMVTSTSQNIRVVNPYDDFNGDTLAVVSIPRKKDNYEKYKD